MEPEAQRGDDKTSKAVKLAVLNLKTVIKGASHMLINISGDIVLADSNEAVNHVYDLSGDNAGIIFSAKYDEAMPVTVIAMG